jgi:hypothetical protein
MPGDRSHHLESYHMPIPLARGIAAILLLASSALVGLTALALVIARSVVDAGVVIVKPADAALLTDVAAVAPFGAGVAVVSFGVAIALFIGAREARLMAGVVALGAVVIGLIGLGLLLLGRDPFAHLASDRALDGIGIVGAFVVLHVAVAVALLFDRTGARRLQSMPQG